MGGFCSIIGNITAAHMWRQVKHIPVRRLAFLFRRGGSQEGASLCKAPSWVAFLLHASLAKQRSMAAGGTSEEPCSTSDHAEFMPFRVHGSETSRADAPAVSERILRGSSFSESNPLALGFDSVETSVCVKAAKAAYPQSPSSFSETNLAICFGLRLPPYALHWKSPPMAQNGTGGKQTNRPAGTAGRIYYLCSDA